MRSPDADAQPSSTFAALRHREFRLLFSGLVASNVGNWMQQFALGWLVVQLAVRDGNPALGGFYLGLRSIATAAPGLAFGLFAGVVADRMDRRDVLVMARVASAGVAVVLAILVITDNVNIIAVMILSAASSASFAFDPPGRQAMLPNVVPPRDFFSALGLTRGSMQLAHTVGPLIAGVLIVPIGVGGVMLAKVALFVASVAALLPMRPQPVEAGARAISMLGSLREGLDYIRRDELIRWCVILQLAFSVLAHSFIQLVPAIAVDTLGVGAVELSWLTAASGVGALFGAALIAFMGDVERRGWLLLGTMLSAGVLLVLLGLQREMLGALVVLTVLSIADQVFLGTQSVILQLTPPDRLRGRVMGTQSMIANTSGPFGVLALGTLGTFIGISMAVLVGGVVVIALALVVAMRATVIRDHRGGSTTAPVSRSDAQAARRFDTAGERTD